MQQHFSPRQFFRWGVIALLCCVLVPTLAAQETEEIEGNGKKVYPRIDTKDESALRENLGKKVTVFGLIKRTKDWDGGANFLNFDGGKFMLVCFESEYANFPDGRPAHTLKDKHIEVTGYINEYKGKLQIKLTHPAQIKIIEPAAKTAEAEEGREDAQKGKGKKSPAKPEKPKKVDPKKYFC